MAEITRDGNSIHIDISKELAQELLDGGLREWIEKEYVPRKKYEELEALQGEVDELRDENSRLKEELDSISANELAKIAAEHVVGIVGGGALEFDTCQAAFADYLAVCRKKAEGM